MTRFYVRFQHCNAVKNVGFVIELDRNSLPCRSIKHRSLIPSAITEYSARYKPCSPGLWDQILCQAFL